ncbi:MAG: 50S ribosomal protein L15 [Candidatus Saccharimonadales bacterium]
MKYHELSTSPKQSKRRVGRGISAGQGKTAGRGTKGQGARAGYSKKPGFEGGQNPLMQRLPKLVGFKSFRSKAEVVYTGQLDALSAKTIDNAAVAAAGLATSEYTKVKVVLKGEVTKKVTVKLQGASAGAIAAIQKAGGSFDKVGTSARPASKKKAE